MRYFVVSGVGPENGVGHHVCKSLLDFDDNISVVGVHHPKSKLSKVLLQNLRFTPVSCDLLSVEEIRLKFRTIAELNVYAFINCAGTNKISWIKNIELSDHEKIMMINANCVIPIVQELRERLKETNGTIINLISVGADRPYTCSLSYNMSKAALKMLTIQMSHELSKSDGIKVIGISPTQISGTDLTKQNEVEICESRGWSIKKLKLEQEKSSLSGQMLMPDDVAELIAGIALSAKLTNGFNGKIINYGSGV